MSYSRCKKKKNYERKRRVKGKGRNGATDRENCGSERIETSYRYESATGCQSWLAYAHLVCSLSSLVSPSCSHAALSRPGNIPFSSVTSAPASRFTSVVSHFDTRRNVSGRWEASSTSALLMDSILYQIGNRLVAVVVIRCSAR